MKAVMQDAEKHNPITPWHKLHLILKVQLQNGTYREGGGGDVWYVPGLVYVHLFN